MKQENSSVSSLTSRWLLLSLRDQGLVHDYEQKQHTKQVSELLSAEPSVPTNMWDQFFLLGVSVWTRSAKTSRGMPDLHCSGFPVWSHWEVEYVLWVVTFSAAILIISSGASNSYLWVNHFSSSCLFFPHPVSLLFDFGRGRPCSRVSVTRHNISEDHRCYCANKGIKPTHCCLLCCLLFTCVHLFAEAKLLSATDLLMKSWFINFGKRRKQY